MRLDPGFLSQEIETLKPGENISVGKAGVDFGLYIFGFRPLYVWIPAPIFLGFGLYIFGFWPPIFSDFGLKKFRVWLAKMCFLNNAQGVCKNKK